MERTVLSELSSHKTVIDEVIKQMLDEIIRVCEITVETLKNGNKILLMGNGGSAADSQHIAAELTGRYKNERKGLPAIALTTDTSALTSISNDYGYEYVFERQVESLAKKNDLLIGISSTGNSENIVNAFNSGKRIGCFTVGLSGKGGGLFNQNCELNLVVPSDDTPRIQEMHILIGHIICQVIDDSYPDITADS